MKLDRQDSTYVRTFALPVLRRFLFVLGADEVELEDFPVLFICFWSSLKFGIQSLSPVALINRPWASEPT